MTQCDKNRRDRKTIENIITKHVEIGSTVYTDGWKDYQHLQKLGYDWDFLNHSENFVKPGTFGSDGVHTKNIEGRWHCIKRWLPISGRYKVEEYLPIKNVISTKNKILESFTVW